MAYISVRERRRTSTTLNHHPVNNNYSFVYLLLEEIIWQHAARISLDITQITPLPIQRNKKIKILAEFVATWGWTISSFSSWPFQQITIDQCDNRTLDLSQRAVTLMTYPSTEGRANPFPLSSCHSQEPQRWWPPPALCRPLSGGSLRKVHWKVYGIAKKSEKIEKKFNKTKKPLVIFLQTDIKAKCGLCDGYEGIKLSNLWCRFFEFWFCCALFHRVSAWEVRNPA